MRVAKVGLGVAGRMRFFFDKENAADLIGNAAEEMSVTATPALVAKFTITAELTKFFQHGGLGEEFMKILLRVSFPLLSFHTHANDGRITEIHLCRTIRFDFPAKLQEVGITGESSTLIFWKILAGTPLGVAAFADEFAGRLRIFFPLFGR